MDIVDLHQLANSATKIMKMALVKDPKLFKLIKYHHPTFINHKFQTILDKVEGDKASSLVLLFVIQTIFEELAPKLQEDSLKWLVDFGHVFSMELKIAKLHQNRLFHSQLYEEECNCMINAIKGLQLLVFHP